jgi:hypothetical protein
VIHVCVCVCVFAFIYINGNMCEKYTCVYVFVCVRVYFLRTFLLSSYAG